MPIVKTPEEEKAELVLELERQLKFLKEIKDSRFPERIKEDVLRVEKLLSELSPPKVEKPKVESKVAEKKEPKKLGSKLK